MHFELVDREYSGFPSHAVRSRMASLALEVLPYAHEYSCVIGEDCSGRVPALVMRHVLNVRREELSLPRVSTRFFSGRSRSPLPDGFLPILTNGQRRLVVTEASVTGASMSWVLHWLAQADMENESKNDVACMSLLPPWSGKPEDPELVFRSYMTKGKGQRIYRNMTFAAVRPNGIDMLHQSERFGTVGITKAPGEVFAVPLPKEKRDFEKERRTREDVRAFGEFILDQTPIYPPGDTFVSY